MFADLHTQCAPCHKHWNFKVIRCVQAKAMQQGPDTKAAAANGNSEPALPGANFGPKYEAHVSEMQSKLDEASKR